MNIVVQSSKWFKFLKSAAMIGTGSAVLWAIFWNPKQGIWKAQRQVCLWSFPREILQGELISVTILRRSPTKQEPRALGSCGASMQGHGHPRVQVFSNVECLQPVGPWLHFFQELEHNPYPYSLHRGNQTLGRSSPVGLELSRIEWQIHFVQGMCSRAETCYPDAHALCTGSVRVHGMMIKSKTLVFLEFQVGHMG